MARSTTRGPGSNQHADRPPVPPTAPSATVSNVPPPVADPFADRDPSLPPPATADPTVGRVPDTPADAVRMVQRGVPFKDAMFLPSWRARVPLFHGTTADRGLAVGDVLEPRTHGHAFAADSLHTARVFSDRDDDRETVVFEVEPVYPDDVWHKQMKHTGNETHHECLSKSGYRIVDVVPASRTPDHYVDRRLRAVEEWREWTGWDGPLP